MARKSSVPKLPPGVREAVAEAIREGRATIEEIVAAIRGLGGNSSRSVAVARRGKASGEQAPDLRRAQEMARTWVEKFGQEPEGDVARLLFELLSTVALHTFGAVQDTGAGMDPQGVFFLARALKELESARKTSVEREAKSRTEIERQKAAAAKNVEELARYKGLDTETVEKLKREFLGIGT